MPLHGHGPGVPQLAAVLRQTAAKYECEGVPTRRGARQYGRVVLSWSPSAVEVDVGRAMGNIEGKGSQQICGELEWRCVSYDSPAGQI